MAKQIRLMMQEHGYMLSGIIEADETYIGGRSKQDEKFDNKTAVIVLLRSTKKPRQSTYH